MDDTVTEVKRKPGRPKKALEPEGAPKAPAIDYSEYEFTERDLVKGLGDPVWRLNNLYKIVDKNTKVVTFRLNAAQTKLLRNLHSRNVILKARQMGFSTFIQLLILDTAIFSPNESGIIIAQDRETSEAIFRDKIRFAYDSLPDAFKTAAPTDGDPSKTAIAFTNGSIIEVRTSARGRTPTILHVSEFGKIAAKDPSKAREIVTGAITAVATKGLIFIESTAEQGEEGEFYKMVTTAIRLMEAGKKLWKLEFKFHFFAWWEDPSYVAPEGAAVISPKDEDYFAEVEARCGIILTPERRTWYILYRDSTYSGDQQMMYQEMPSYWEEAFKVSLEGAYFTEQFRAMRKQDRITDVPYDPQYPVSTFWDLGADDYTAIWFIQARPGYYAVINYMEDNGEPFNYFVELMDTLNYVYDYHYLPHDSKAVKQGKLKNESPEEMLQELAPHWRFWVIDRIPDKTMAIAQARNFLPLCVFDQSKCKQGLRHLENYRKAWNDRANTWRATPKDGPETHASDAFLQAGQAKAAGIFGAVGGNGIDRDLGEYFPEPNFNY